MARPPGRQILSGALQFFPGTPLFIPRFFGPLLRLAFSPPEAPAKTAAGAKAAGTDLATDQAIF